MRRDADPELCIRQGTQALWGKRRGNGYAKNVHFVDTTLSITPLSDDLDSALNIGANLTIY